MQHFVSGGGIDQRKPENRCRYIALSLNGFCFAGHGTAGFEPDQWKVWDSLGALLSPLHRLQTWSKHCTLPVQTVLLLFCQSLEKQHIDFIGIRQPMQWLANVFYLSDPAVPWVWSLGPRVCPYVWHYLRLNLQSNQVAPPDRKCKSVIQKIRPERLQSWYLSEVVVGQLRGGLPLLVLQEPTPVIALPPPLNTAHQSIWHRGLASLNNPTCNCERSVIIVLRERF